MRKKQYKRPIEYPYDNAYFLADAANAAALYPKFLNIGGLVLTYPPNHLLLSPLHHQPLTPLFFFPFSQKHQRPQHLHRPQHHLFYLRSFPRRKFLHQKG